MKKILPLGDSITFGCGSTCDGLSKDCAKNPYKNLLKYGFLPAIPCNKCSSGYRGYLKNKLKNNKKLQKFDIVGTEKNGETRHNGYPGWTINMVRKKLKIWIETKPDIILIHLGTNDLGWGLSTSKKTCFQMKLLINEIYMHLPNVHIFLATIIYIPWFYGGRFHKDYNDCLKKLVKSYMKNNKKITLVEMSKNFDKHDLCPDKIHPVDSGYKIMAENWYKALSKLY